MSIIIMISHLMIYDSFVRVDFFVFCGCIHNFELFFENVVQLIFLWYGRHFHTGRHGDLFTFRKKCRHEIYSSIMF